MTYTIIDTSGARPEGVVVPTVVDALALARRLEREARSEPVIAAGDGWILTIDELEELARS